MVETDCPYLARSRIAASAASRHLRGWWPNRLPEIGGVLSRRWRARPPRPQNSSSDFPRFSASDPFAARWSLDICLIAKRCVPCLYWRDLDHAVL